MSTGTIANACGDREVTVQEAFDMLTKADMLSDAFVRLLLAALEDPDADDILIRGDTKSASWPA